MLEENFMIGELKRRIEKAYSNSGNTMGWRFLYSPEITLDEARVVFIGLNPGGSFEDKMHGNFAMEKGSAYVGESWAGHPPGESRLQKQVLALFARLDERPAEVLAGNLVPFRSPNWASLRNPTEALRFGSRLWSVALERAGPTVVITMGSVTTEAIAKVLQIEKLHKVHVGWGNVMARKGYFDKGMFIGLPHLSRYAIMTREKSTPYLDKLFADVET
jgi:uracil DNA glycosylase superfamily protein